MSLEINEYTSLWEEHGVELPASLKNRKPLKKTRPATTTKKAKAAPKAPKLQSLNDVETWLGDCKRCSLCSTRNKIVFGTGNPKAKLMFVGEGPGADEDEQGLPFVGRAGQLLNKIIEAMGYERKDVYIANIVKCRPPSNRVPEPDEVANCLPFLKAQIDIVKPQLVVALGLTAATHLTGKQVTMSQLRGKFHSIDWKPELEVLPTYHPAYLLRNPDAKKIVWDDMKIVMKRIKKTK